MSTPPTMRPRLRTFVLFLHVASSVGWLGTAVAYLALCALVVGADTAPTVRALLHAMTATVTYVVLPSGIASFATGLVSSLGTAWGLFRHWWVVAKLLLTGLSLVVLGVYLHEIGMVVDQAEAAATAAELADVQSPGIMSHVVAGVVVLLVAVALAVYKPKGLTGWWRRRQDERRAQQVRGRSAERGRSGGRATPSVAGSKG
jgi:hypothetical protein